MTSSATAYIDRLQAVNKRLNTTNIRGKDYAEVNQRVLGFWELFPNGRIITRWLELNETRATCMAFIFTDRTNTAEMLRALSWSESERGNALLALYADATATAYEVKTGSGVNSTSYIENAETSAVGRALGMLGIGATNAIASAGEVSNAIQAQEQAKRATSQSKAARRPNKASTEKVPAKPAKTTQTAAESATGALDATEAARRRLIDACNLLAAVTGREAKEIMQLVARQEGFTKTAEGYSAAAKWVEESARAKGVMEVTDNE